MMDTATIDGNGETTINIISAEEPKSYQDMAVDTMESPSRQETVETQTELANDHHNQSIEPDPSQKSLRE